MTKNGHYAVFGNPISQSKSPQIHHIFARQTDEAISYTKQLVELGDFAEAAREFFELGGRGLNVTVPFKEDAFDYADELSERAKTAGAVNTLALRDDGSVFGDNTDGAGLVWDISQRLGWPLERRRVLMLGAGGAVRGVLLPLMQAGPGELVIANRTESKANQLAETFSGLGNIGACAFQSLSELPAFDVIINGTSASLAGAVPDIPRSSCDAQTKVYDMAYADTLTPFLAWAEDQGCDEFADGFGMLVAQAAESFYLWRGKRPRIEVTIKELRPVRTI